MKTYKAKEDWDKYTYDDYSGLLGAPRGTVSRHKKEDLYKECIRKGLISNELPVLKKNIPVEEEKNLVVTEKNIEAKSLCVFDNTDQIELLKSQAEDMEIDNELFLRNLNTLARRSATNAFTLVDKVISGELKISKKNTSHINFCAKFLKGFLSTPKTRNNRQGPNKTTKRTATFSEEISENT